MSSPNRLQEMPVDTFLHYFEIAAGVTAGFAVVMIAAGFIGAMLGFDG